jgi:hypothetical protein
MSTRSNTTKGVTDAEALARLPKWAADRIRNLEGSLEQARAQIQRTAAQEPTRTGLGYHMDLRKAGEPAMWLPDDHVTFYLPDRRRERDTFIQVRFADESGEMRLRVMASDGPLDVRPEASNVVSLGVRDR